MERLLLPIFVGIVIFFVIGKLIHVRFIKYASIFFFGLSVVLFIYFFYQMNYYNEICIPEDGCMNEFGAFILLPIMSLLISMIMFISTFLNRKKPRKDEFS